MVINWQTFRSEAQVLVFTPGDESSVSYQHLQHVVIKFLFIYVDLFLLMV